MIVVTGILIGIIIIIVCSYLKGMLAFGYEECGQYDKAKQSAQEV